MILHLQLVDLMDIQMQFVKLPLGIGLSKLTMPHPMVRILLIEQLYRAMSINHNHPYHRA